MEDDEQFASTGWWDLWRQRIGSPRKLIGDANDFVQFVS
jgi:hypothetical protein